MDRPRHNDLLAVNKIGKSIRKIPKPRLQPAALTQINRPYVPPPAMPHNITAESHVSVCMPYLQSSLGNQMQPSQSHSPWINGSSRDKPILPSPRLNGPPQLNLPSLRFNGRGMLPSPFSVRMPSLQSSLGPNRNQMQPSHEHHSPQFNGSASSVPILPSLKFHNRGILPSPTSQHLLKSPTAYRSMLSPTVQYPPPLRPTSFTLSSMAQPGILGPGKLPQSTASPPPSPHDALSSSPFSFG